MSSAGSAQARFEDTNQMFVAPTRFDLPVSAEGAPQYWAEQALAQLRSAFDPQKRPALFVARVWLGVV
jgi:hypothetical protein